MALATVKIIVMETWPYINLSMCKYNIKHIYSFKTNIGRIRIMKYVLLASSSCFILFFIQDLN
jgi:hypothetical protein